MTQSRLTRTSAAQFLWTMSLGAAISIAALAPAGAQRGGGGRGDSSGSRSDSSSGRSEGSRHESQSRSSDSSPRRDYSPPARSYDPPARRDYSPPQRNYDPPARRDYTPPQRSYDPPARRDDSPRRDYTPTQRNYDPPVRRDESPRRDYSPPVRRDESPRRDYSPPVRRDETPLRQDESRRRDTSPAPERDRSTIGGQESHTDRAPIRRTTEPDRGAGNTHSDSIFNRSRPSHDSSSRTQDERNHETMTRGPLGRNPELPRPYSGGALGANRGANQFPERNRAHDIFTRSSEGRRYNNGIVLHEGIHYSQPYFQRYHSSSSFFFGFYSPAFSFSTCYYSPYSYYYDVCPPYIYRSHCFYYPPPVVYIEVPIYVGGTSYGYDSDRDDYYLSRGNYSFDEQERESGLDRAVDDIREAFRFGNIEPLVQLTDPNIKISVFRKGKYEYSMSANDYLDMTRDMLRTTETVKFDLYRVRRRSAGVYVVSGRHEYNDRDGRHRTVYVSFVLERVYSRWTLTQVGTAPDRIQEF